MIFFPDNMHPLTLWEAENKLNDEVALFKKDLKILIAESETENLESDIRFIQKLRKRLYEDMNQLQHSFYLIKAAKWYEQHIYTNPEKLYWKWHPKQTGTAEDTDLMAYYEYKRGRPSPVMVAELTTSPNPIGTIETRMSNTLKNLANNKNECRKFYFVCSQKMKTRADVKIRKGGYGIEVINLGDLERLFKAPLPA